jgi:dihydroxy-acid dehydratase
MDPVLLLLSALLLASLAAFLSGILPYPFGLLVLAALIAARLLYRREPGRRRRQRGRQ